MPSGEPVISMRNVNHFYGEGALRRQVLFNVTCDIQAGEIVIITGPSGSGKTTALTLAGALRSVQEGSMRILGRELNGAPAGTLVKIREHIGFIFQAHNLVACLTALQNVQMALSASVDARSAARAKEMLGAVGLSQRAHYLPGRLSGGERQRVAVARALVRGPKVVLADEPTAALDRQSGRDVVELLRQLARRQGCTVLMVTHDHRILEIADRVMQLEDGRLGSFEGVTSPHAGHLLTALAEMPEREQLESLLEQMSEREFLDLVKTIGTECEQLLNVMNLGARDAMRRLLQNLLDTVFRKAVKCVDAEDAALLELRHGAWQPVVDSSTAAGRLSLWTEKAATQCQVVNSAGAELGTGLRSLLCIPLQDRLREIRGVAQLVNRRGAGQFSAADERAFSDFAGPLAMLLESYQRVGQ